MKRIIFLFVLFFTGQLAFGQGVLDQRRAEAMKDPKFIEFKKRHEDLAKQQQSGELKSEYYNYDETLKSFFINDQIPGATPKSSSAQSKEEYVKQLNSWIIGNKQYLKSAHKNSLIKE